MTGRLPNFLVLGGMRCGSTTLHRVLSAHPNIFMPKQKELHFFDGYNPDLGEDLTHYKAVFAEATQQQLCGEVTPDYLTTPGAFERIAETFNELKLIVILREPVARLYSHYMMSIAAGFEVLSFQQAIKGEASRLERRDKIADIFHSYTERSTYLPKLQRYAQHFGKDNVCVLFLEELNTQPQSVLNQLWSFLNVDNVEIEQLGSALQATNQHKEILRQRKQHTPLKAMLKKVSLLNALFSKTAMSRKQKLKLEAHFKEHNDSLSEWLGRDLPW